MTGLPTRVAGRRFAVPVTLTALLVFCGCGDDPVAPGDDESDEPATGAVRVETTTSGSSLDSDGYELSVDGAPGPAIELNGTLSVTDLTPGPHELELQGIAPNCGVAAENPQRIEVVAGETTSVSFPVSCFDPTGTIDVTSSTTGATPDPNGYELFVDGSLRRRVDTNGSVSIANLVPGDHLIELRAVESNCVVTGENPRTVVVAAYETTPVTFSIECAYIARVLAFVTDRRANPAGPEIFLMDAQGMSPVNLRADREMDTDPAWSPDGGRLAFTRDGGWFNPDVFITNVGGTVFDRLTDTGFDVSPSWSPDGSRIAVSDDQAVFLVNVDGSGRTLLADGPGFDGQPAWSPDGLRIAFTTERDGNAEIYVMEADGSAPMNLTNHPADDRQPAWAW